MCVRRHPDHLAEFTDEVRLIVKTQVHRQAGGRLAAQLLEREAGGLPFEQLRIWQA